MKNQFAKMVKIFDKANRLYVGQTKNGYYITGGMMGIEMPEFVYRYAFMTEKPYYKEIEQGKGYSMSMDDRKSLDFCPCDALDIERILTPADIRELYTLTNIVINLPLFSATVLYDDKNALLIQTKYIEAALDTGLFKGFEAKNNAHSIVVSRSADNQVTFFCCPIRKDAEMSKTLKQIANVW